MMGMLHDVGEVKPEKGEGWQCYIGCSREGHRVPNKRVSMLQHFEAGLISTSVSLMLTP